MSALEDLAERSGQEFPHLLEARDRTERELPAMRDRLREVEIDADVSVVLFGSWGRGADRAQRRRLDHPRQWTRTDGCASDGGR